MWVKIKEWFISRNFLWCGFGWQINELLTRPNLLNLALVGFWIWLLTTEE